MLGAGTGKGGRLPEYVRDNLYARLFVPWTLPESEWPLCQQDWERVTAITALPWAGSILDVGSGDGTLAAMVCSRNPRVSRMTCIEPDRDQVERIEEYWKDHWWPMIVGGTFDHAERGKPYDGATCCEVLEHLPAEEGAALLSRLHGLLKPGAMCCVTVPYYKGSRADYPGHLRKYKKGQLTDELRAAGFRHVFIEDIGFPPIWIMVDCYA
jgi:phospholipid N-methyltransferase